MTLSIVSKRRRRRLRGKLREAEDDNRRRASEAIAAMLAFRDSGAIKPVTIDEILAWRHEGHKY